MLDLQSLEANTVKDLIINQTRLETQKNKPSRDSSYSSTSKYDKNQQRREGKSWTTSPERRKSWDKKNQNDKYDDKKRTNYRQRVIQRIQIRQMTDLETQIEEGKQIQEAHQGTTEMLTRTIDEQIIERDKEVDNQIADSQVGTEVHLCVKKVIGGAVV